MKTYTLASVALCCLLLQTRGIDAQADIFNTDILKIDIAIPMEAWQDTLAARKTRDDKTPVVGVVEIDGKAYPDIEIRFKGNSSFHAAVKYGGNKLPMKIECPKGKEFAGGYDELRLSNNFRDPSAVRELLAYEIASTYVPVPRVAPAVLTINGEYIGVFTVTEGMSDRMLKEVYCNDDGVLIKCDPEFNHPQPAGCPKGEYSNLKYLGDDPACYKPLYDNASKEEGAAIVELARNLAQSNDHSAYLNVNQTLWMHALNNVLVNLDSYLGIFCHNYFVYKDVHGMYHPLIWDLNLAFGGFATLDNQVNPDPFELSPIVHDKYLKGRRPLIESLLSDRVNQLTYFYMITTIVNDWFVDDKYLELAQEWQDIIRPYRSLEVEPLYPMSDFEISLDETVKRGDNRSIPGIGQLMERRKAYLLSHPLLQRQSPQMIEWSSQELPEGTVITIKTASEITEAYLYYQPEQCGPWKRASMNKLSNVTWQSNAMPVYQFYIQIATEAAAALSPSSAPGAVYMVNKGS